MIVCDACRKSIAELKSEKVGIQAVTFGWSVKDLVTSNASYRPAATFNWDLCQDCLDAFDLAFKQVVLKVIHKHPGKETSK